MLRLSKSFSQSLFNIIVVKLIHFGRSILDSFWDWNEQKNKEDEDDEECKLRVALTETLHSEYNGWWKEGKSVFRMKKSDAFSK